MTGTLVQPSAFPGMPATPAPPAPKASTFRVTTASSDGYEINRQVEADQVWISEGAIWFELQGNLAAVINMNAFKRAVPIDSPND